MGTYLNFADMHRRAASPELNRNTPILRKLYERKTEVMRRCEESRDVMGDDHSVERCVPRGGNFLNSQCVQCDIQGSVTGLPH